MSHVGEDRGMLWVASKRLSMVVSARRMAGWSSSVSMSMVFLLFKGRSFMGMLDGHGAWMM